MMSKRWVIIGAGVAVGCCLLAGTAVGLLLLLGRSGGLLETYPPIETTSPDASQIAQCRQLLGFRPEAVISVERYVYQPGFLDDSMRCVVRAEGDSLDVIFDTAVVDPTLSEAQEVAPGRYVTLTIEALEPGVYRIDGTWFET